MKITYLEFSILQEIERRGGKIVSLYNLTKELCLSYPYVYMRVMRLARAGVLCVERKKGYPMTITLLKISYDFRPQEKQARVKKARRLAPITKFVVNR